MAHHFAPTPDKTYATRENAVKAVEKAYGPNEELYGAAELHYITMQNPEGRWFPVFIGERALQRGVHHKFCVMA
jgi:hypothetical protein